MGRLTNKLIENEDAKQEKENRQLPTYGIDGKAVRTEAPQKKRRGLSFLLVLVIVLGLIYVPGRFMSDKTDTTEVTKDSTAISLSNTALRNNPSGDFDNDGLLNSEETEIGTSPWSVDTDGDCISDYAELYTTETDPLSSDSTLVTLKKKEDEADEKSVGTPYKIGNVILWADDYESKAYGSVIETMTGYHFTYFNGYAQFPESGYAYKVEDGIHTLLTYREEEDVWKVSAGDYVEIFDEKLEEVVKVSLFGFPVYLDYNLVTSVLARILPDKGFITALTMTEEDIDPDTSELTSTDVVYIEYDASDTERFMQNSNTLSDLGSLQAAIQEGSCVLISLFDSDYGEYVGIVYAYDVDGNLYVADPITGEYVGVLNIYISSKMLLDDTGESVSYSYYNFEGLGFSSFDGDRISIFAASGSSSTSFGESESGDAQEEETEEEDTDDDESSPGEEAQEASEELIEEAQ